MEETSEQRMEKLENSLLDLKKSIEEKRRRDEEKRRRDMEELLFVEQTIKEFDALVERYKREGLL